MKKVYVVIDIEKWTNIAVDFDEKKVIEKTLDYDIYFSTVQEFYDNFDDRYLLETLEVK